MIIYSHTRIANLISKPEVQTVIEETVTVEEEKKVDTKKKEKNFLEEISED